MFLLQIGLIKSRFHYFKGPKLQIPWFLGFSTRHQAPKPTLFIFGDTRTPKTNQEKSWEYLKTIIFCVHMGINNFENCWKACTSFFRCCFRCCVYHFLDYIWEEEDRQIIQMHKYNLQNIGYGFHIYQKHEMEIL